MWSSPRGWRRMLARKGAARARLPTRRRALSLIGADRQLQHDSHLFAQRDGCDDLGIGTVLEHVHEQFARIAVRHLELVAAVLEPLALLLRMPVLVGDPARGVRRKADRRPGFRRAGKNAVAR